MKKEEQTKKTEVKEVKSEPLKVADSKKVNYAQESTKVSETLKEKQLKEIEDDEKDVYAFKPASGTGVLHVSETSEGPVVAYDQDSSIELTKAQIGRSKDLQRMVASGELSKITK